MTDFTAWGPLAHLIGTWEGDEGLDVAFAHTTGSVGETPYRERIVMKPFGPVDNGTQALYGLDYRMSAWRGDEDDPFHTEVGYWLWDAADCAVMRCFMIPRGSTVLAGGIHDRRRDHVHDGRRRADPRPTEFCRTRISPGPRARPDTS